MEVEQTIVHEMGNKGALDLANNWSVGGCTRHVDVRNFLLLKLKGEGLLMIKHIPGEENDADIFTKNAVAQVFERHAPKFVRNDEYLKAQTLS